jgi:adenylyltransferase/sulfurtransferase
VSTTTPAVPEITVEELKQKLDARQDVFILDVREPNEYKICNLNGHLIPLNELPKRLQELDAAKDKDTEIVVHCHRGGRSARAVAFLQQAGYKQAKNLKGGILDWANKIDPKMAKY